MFKLYCFYQRMLNLILIRQQKSHLSIRLRYSFNNMVDELCPMQDSNLLILVLGTSCSFTSHIGQIEEAG